MAISFSEMGYDKVYTVNKAPKETDFQAGFHVYISSMSKSDLDCVELEGWRAFDEIPGLDNVTLDDCHDWVVETDTNGSRAFRITPEWIRQQKLIIEKYERVEGVIK